MKLDKQNQIRSTIIKALKSFIDEEFEGNRSKAASFLKEDRRNLHKYLVGDVAGLDKLIDLLEKTKKYELVFKVKKR